MISTFTEELESVIACIQAAAESRLPTSTDISFGLRAADTLEACDRFRLAFGL